MRSLIFRASVLLLAALSITGSLFGQAATGTITGTITDPAGAVVAAAAIEVKNTETGQIYPTVSTETGAYTVPSLPVGPYQVTVTVQGFKKYNRTGVTLSAAQTVGIDIALEVGAASESVSVNAEASLLKTETGDIAHNITLQQLDNLPILGIGGANAGSSGVRNPYNSTTLIPGVSYTSNSVMIVNGAPNNTASYRLEGMDNTNHTVSFALQQNQPSADAVQEIAVQTSNYAAEFGTAGGGLFNLTMKSGTNRYSGSVYDYFVNEALNAAVPFSNDGKGNKITPRNRRNNYGGTIGGPISIPHLYDGKNRSFFFFSYEAFKESSIINFPVTLPTDSYRAGDFSAISPNGGAKFNTSLGVPAAAIGVDALGRNVFSNTVFDPNTRRAAPNGTLVADPFPGNVIPAGRFDPVSVAFLKLVPNAPLSGLTSNYPGSNLSIRDTKIPSIKIDHTVNPKLKVSGYWSTTGTDSPFSTPNGNADGLPANISVARGTFIHTLTERLNVDYNAAPTLLLHFGAGYSRNSFVDDSPFQHDGGTFDCKSVGLQGCQGNVNLPTLQSTVSGTLGGMQQLGNATAHTHTLTLRPGFNANATYIRGNHTYKAGAEVTFQGNITAPPSGTNFTFGGASQLPANLATGGATGFPFASYLLGGVTAAQQVAPTNPRMGKSQWAFFLQDSFKVNRKLTIDYGLRYDLATVPHEHYGRSGNLGNGANPNAGGRNGIAIFEQTCNCSFIDSYKLALGPRLGFAYNLNSKTVIRGGWGFAFGFAPDIGQNSSSNSINNPAGTNTYLQFSSPTVLPQPVWPNFSPAQTPLAGQITGYGGFTALDANAARPPRQNQWSIGIQREITKDFVMEASYVANRGVWWSGGPLGLLNQPRPEAFAALGLKPYSVAADNILLSSTLSAAAVTSRIGNYLPYSGYATTNTLRDAVRPLPQFSTIAVTGSATGNTWYDSLQVKGTKRLSHGIQVNGTFTWSKALTRTSEVIFNPASAQKSIQSTDQPFLFNANIVYTTQKYFKNNWINTVVKDWQFGSFLQYGSGLPLTPPAQTSANNLTGGEMIRTGAPLFLKDLNCHCINPYTDLVLNRDAWKNPDAGTWGPGPTTLFYSDYRAQRHPSENLNIGRNFRVRERMNLQIRAEFSNIFNRTQLGNPVLSAPFNATNAINSPTVSGGRYTGGFGVYTIGSVTTGIPSGTTAVPSGANQLFSGPRTGTLIARFTF